MTYQWFKIFNSVEFEALGLVSRTYSYNLAGIGSKTILVTKGVALGMTYEGVFLSLGLNGKNPEYFDTYGIYKNPDTNDVYLGIGTEDDES